jgi:hypothetical protein
MIPSMIALLVTLFLAPEVTTDVGEVATLTVRWDKGAVTILKVDRAPLPRRTHLQRFRGRFEARALGAGSADKVLDFVRFDFPLMAMADSADEMGEEAAELGARMRAHVTATTSVRVPLPPGATVVAVYDTGTHKLVTASLSPSRPAADRQPGPAPAAASTPASAGAAGSTRK